MQFHKEICPWYLQVLTIYLTETNTWIVVPLEEGEELTIWDSKESEFASGLEFKRVFE